jgi:adiponectin receptor
LLVYIPFCPSVSAVSPSTPCFLSRLDLGLENYMALYRRLSPTGADGIGADADGSIQNKDPQAPKTTRRLLTAAEVPSWYAHNAFIRTGYRPVTGSVKLCFDSLRYVHNETANIYTHLVPAGIAVIGNYSLYLYFSSHYPNASWTDQLVFHIYLSTSVICFGISSMYHMLLCHSETYAGLWGRLDYVAIVFQILGSFISGIYIGFYCEPHLQKLYWTMVCCAFPVLDVFILTNLPSDWFPRITNWYRGCESQASES